MANYYGQSKSPGFGAPAGRYSWETDALDDLRRQEEAYNFGYQSIAPQQQAYQQAVANQQAIYGNTAALNQQIQGDPLDAMIRAELQKQLDSSGLEKALFSQATDMGAAANAQRSGQIVNDVARRGGNINDPSVQAALRQSQTQQQQGAQSARRDATLAGYQQRGQGVQQASGYGAQRAGTLMQSNRDLTNALSMPSIVRPQQTVNATGRPQSAVIAGMNAAGGMPLPPGYSTVKSPAMSFAEWQRSQGGR